MMTTMITSQGRVADTEELLASLSAALADLRREIESLTGQAGSGEEISETAASRTLGKLAGMVGSCVKMENYLNECARRDAGIARGDHAFDLERARAEIGCKLDRLRCPIYPK